MVEIDGVGYDIPTNQVGMSFEIGGPERTVRRTSESEAMISPSPVRSETTFGKLEFSGWRLTSSDPDGNVWVHPDGRAVATNGRLEIERIEDEVPENRGRRTARRARRRRVSQTLVSGQTGGTVTFGSSVAQAGVSQTLIGGRTGGTVTFHAPTVQMGIVSDRRTEDGVLVTEADRVSTDTHQGVARRAYPTESDPMRSAVIRPSVSIPAYRTKLLTIDGIVFRSSDGGYVQLFGSRVVALSGELVVSNP
jgi:hypothetical protein